MRNSYAESGQEALARIIDKKIIPELSKILEKIPDLFRPALMQSSRIVPVVKGQEISEGGPSSGGCLFFVDNTILRSFYYDARNSRERTSRLSIRNDVVVDVNSFITGKNREDNVQALEDGKVLSINFTNLKTLLHDFPEMHKVLWHFQALRDDEYAFYQHLLKIPLDERVEIFLDNHPNLPNRINHDYIAQYLNVDRSSFSQAYRRYRAKRGGSDQSDLL